MKGKKGETQEVRERSQEVFQCEGIWTERNKQGPPDLRHGAFNNHPFSIPFAKNNVPLIFQGRHFLTQSKKDKNKCVQ